MTRGRRDGRAFLVFVYGPSVDAGRAVGQGAMSPMTIVRGGGDTPPTATFPIAGGVTFGATSTCRTAAAAEPRNASGSQTRARNRGRRGAAYPSVRTPPSS